MRFVLPGCDGLSRSLSLSIAILLLAACVLAACGGAPGARTSTAQPVAAEQAAAATASTAPTRGVSGSDAAAYCTEKGGAVRTRYPTYNTNGDPHTWVRMHGSLEVCEFIAQDGSQISIALSTLYSQEPTLAVLAYLEKPEVQAPAHPGVNPSTVYCAQLGGTDLWGGKESAAGGGWTTDDPQDAFRVMSMCVFSDLSAIDSWGLTYHANGIIRGVDLATVIRYDPQDPPRVFR